MSFRSNGALVASQLAERLTKLPSYFSIDTFGDKCIGQDRNIGMGFATLGYTPEICTLSESMWSLVQGRAPSFPWNSPGFQKAGAAR